MESIIENLILINNYKVNYDDKASLANDVEINEMLKYVLILLIIVIEKKIFLFVKVTSLVVTMVIK